MATAVWLVAFAALAQRDHALIVRHAGPIAAWIVVVWIINLFPVDATHPVSFTSDDSIIAAAALLFSPVETGLIAFVGALDRTELAGGRRLSKALWNHSVVGLSWLTGSWFVHAVSARTGVTAALVPLSLLVISVELVVDSLLIGITIWLEPRRVSLRAAFGHLRLGVLPDFLLVYLASASLGAMLVALHDAAGLLALPMVLPPVLLSRQALMRSKMFAETHQAYRHREVAFAELARQMDRERRDERRLVAADLHDELLPALFQVTLLGQVVRTELQTGRLLELETDVSLLMTTVDAAADVGRQIIGDLRRSTLGAGGLSRALARLCQVVQGQTTIEVTCTVEAVRTSEERELALYQIAKEAVGNAVQHSRARWIRVTLGQDRDRVVLEVVDDGTGFDPFVEREDHYGLVVMRERAVAAGATLYVDAGLGQGCAIRVSVPADPS